MIAQISPLIQVVLGVAGLIGLAVLAFVIWLFWPGHRHDCTEKRYLADRGNPQRRWVHGVMAIYQGDRGDPAYWDQDCARAHAEGWSIHSAADLQKLLHRYHAGECNPAFDKARLIWLARIGQGCGWLPEAQSWEWCEQAAQVLRQHYPDWPAFQRDVVAGKADWYDGAPPPETVRQGIESNQFAMAKVLPQLPFR